MKTSKFFLSTLIAAAAMSANAYADDYTWDRTQDYSFTWDFSQANTKNGSTTGVLGGTVTNTFATEVVNEIGKTVIKEGDTDGSYWEVDTNSFFYDSLQEVTKATAGTGTLTFSVDYYWTGAQWGENILHIGRNDTGVALGLSNGYISFATGTATDDKFNAEKTNLRLNENAWNTITWTLTGDLWSVSLNGGGTVSGGTIADITWDANAAERNKYSIGIKAPGWNSGATGLNDSGCKLANLSVVYEGIEFSNLVWAGGVAGGIWDKSAASWEGGIAFADGDSVTFNTADATVTVSGLVTPGTVTISENTTFTGTGTIAVGVGALTIADEKTVSLDAGVTLDLGSTGAIVEKSISGQGIVKVASTATGHAVSVKLADTFEGTVDFTGKLNTGELRLGEGATLKLSKSGGYSSLWGGGTVACNVLFQTDYQIGDSSATTINFSGDVSSADGTTVTILSNSTATFNGSASFANLSSSGMTVFNGDVSGNLVASAGTIRFNAADTHRTYTSNVTLENSATLSIYDASAVSASSEGNYQFAFTGDIAVNGTNTLASNWGKEIAFQGDLSGEGSLTYTRATDGGVNMNGRLIVDGEDKDFSGTITVDASNNNSLGIDLNASLANATIVLTGGSSNPAFMSIWKDVSVKRLDGTGTAKIGVGYASTSSMTGGNFKLTIGEGEFAGIIQDKSYRRGAGTNPTLVTDGVLGIIKNTEGTLTLSGDNTYTGGTTISEGTLVAAHANALGTGPVDILSGATLQADTQITLSNDLTLNVTENDLVSLSRESNTPLITGNGVELAQNASLYVNIGALAREETLALQLAAGSALLVEESQIKIGAWVDSTWWEDEYYTEVSWNSETGVLTLAIPEPSLFGLLAGLGALTLVGTRRRRSKKA